jgi:RNA polymerase subunit RPABC4/transcription elongation factor Spt4
MKQCKRCGSFTFGGFCPVCGNDPIKLGIENRINTFNEDRWIAEKLNIADQKNLIVLEATGSRKIEDKKILKKDKILRAKAEYPMPDLVDRKPNINELAKYVSVNQELNTKWLNKLNEDSGFIDDISGFVMKKDTNSSKENIDNEKKKELDDLILK